MTALDPKVTQNNNKPRRISPDHSYKTHDDWKGSKQENVEGKLKPFNRWNRA